MSYEIYTLQKVAYSNFTSFIIIGCPLLLLLYCNYLYQITPITVKKILQVSKSRWRNNYTHFCLKNGICPKIALIFPYAAGSPLPTPVVMR